MVIRLVFQSIVYVFFATLIYGCCVANPKTSKLSYFLNRTIPTYIIRRVGYGSLQIVYLVVVLGSWYIIFAYGYPAIIDSDHIDDRHQYTGYVVFVVCLSSHFYASNKSPGSVTEETILLFDHYEYDNVFYTRRNCPTLKIRKIARSKYDRYTKKHVPRFDHFCGWLNQAVGEQNYRWFLLFLFVHVIMCVYGSWAMGTILYGEIVDKELWNTNYRDIFLSLFSRHKQIVGVLLLMLLIVVCLGFFLGFHLYLSCQNMTTNEYYKWKELAKSHNKAKLRYMQALIDGTVLVQDNTTRRNLPSQLDSDVDVGCMGPVDSTSKVQKDDEICDPGPLPTNIYNKGIMANLKEVLIPLSFCQEAKSRYQSFCSQKNGNQNEGDTIKKAK